MTYHCILQSRVFDKTHFEPLAADNINDAALEAAKLLRGQSDIKVAHIFQRENRILTLRPDDPLIAD